MAAVRYGHLITWVLCRMTHRAMRACSGNGLDFAKERGPAQILWRDHQMGGVTQVATHDVWRGSFFHSGYEVTGWRLSSYR